MASNPFAQCDFEVRLSPLTAKAIRKCQSGTAIGRVYALQHENLPNGAFTSMVITNNTSEPSHSADIARQGREPLDVTVVQHVATTNSAESGIGEVVAQTHGMIGGEASVVVGESHHFARGHLGARQHSR
jgi:hypothetical protein